MGDVFLNICWNNSKKELSAFFANATSFYIISISLIICLFLSPLSASNSLHFLPIVSSSTFVMLISSLYSLPFIFSNISVMSLLFFSFLTCSSFFSSHVFSSALIPCCLLSFFPIIHFLSGCNSTCTGKVMYFKCILYIHLK